MHLQFAIAYHWECMSLKAVESGPVKIHSLETQEYSEVICPYLMLSNAERQHPEPARQALEAEAQKLPVTLPNGHMEVHSEETVP